jgi:hypothetical protein
MSTVPPKAPRPRPKAFECACCDWDPEPAIARLYGGECWPRAATRRGPQSRLMQVLGEPRAPAGAARFASINAAMTVTASSLPCCPKRCRPRGGTPRLAAARAELPAGRRSGVAVLQGAPATRWRSTAWREMSLASATSGLAPEAGLYSPVPAQADCCLARRGGATSPARIIDGSGVVRGARYLALGWPASRR